MGGLVALFFLFNTGQLSAEKTKLVNTADAVASSAGAMHARALNFDAYTNRALMANEVMIAQMVSLASWGQYAQSHVDNVPVMNCYSWYSVPVALALVEYAPLCYALSYPVGAEAVQVANEAIQAAAPIVVAAAEVAKTILQASQVSMHDKFLSSRQAVMQEVANANYNGDGAVQVDAEALSDSYRDFDGKEFIQRYSGNDRGRFQDATLTAAYKDKFVRQRAWSSHSPWPCIVMPRGDVNRTGGTGMVGFDEWKATDTATFHQESWDWTKMRCNTDLDMTLGEGSQTAAKDDGSGAESESAASSGSFGSGGFSSSDWNYSGLPSFYDLSDKALDYTPENADKNKRDPRVRFAIRITRAKTQAMSAAGRSQIKPEGRLKIFQGSEAGDVLAAVATSEVFFARPQPRSDGSTELASLFNPYWQVRLSSTSDADLQAAKNKQVGTAP